MICQGKYEEHQIAFMQLTEDLSSGFAMTVDSFCTGGGVGNNFIMYKEINFAENGTISDRWLEIQFSGKKILFSARPLDRVYNYEACRKLFSDRDYDKMARFLEVAKNF